MTALSQQAERLLNEFSTQPGVTSNHMRALRDSFSASPELAAQLNRAASMPTGSPPVFSGFTIQAPNVNAGATYQPDTGKVAIPLSVIADALINRENSGNLTILLAHELEHATNAPQMRAHYHDFGSAAIKIARQPNPGPRDYSVAINTMLGKNLWDESTAQIQAWNTLVSRLGSEGTPLTLKEMHLLGGSRMNDFIDKSAAYPPPLTP